MFAASLLGMAACALLPASDGGARGKDLFGKRCSGCHDLDRDKEGPRLRGVYGRVAGKVPTFRYSDGMKAALFRWDDESLNRWLTDPDAVVRDNDMAFHVADSTERAEIIAWLRAQSTGGD
jgi:cytochrome c